VKVPLSGLSSKCDFDAGWLLPLVRAVGYLSNGKCQLWSREHRAMLSEAIPLVALSAAL